MSPSSSGILIDSTPDVRMAGVPTVGEVVLDKYQVNEVIGTGGMGVVLGATHLGLRQRVALKILLPTITDESDVRRFSQEARAAAKIRSEHVARVMDVGELPSGLPFMVLEYLEGETLWDVMHRRGPLPVHEAVDFMLQAAEALAEAHALGIVHRDLKPNNLFLARKPDGRRTIKVLDFGIAKKVSPDRESGPPLTALGSLPGTVGYMPPEQIRNPSSVDHRADIWALCVVLQELLTGEQLFAANSVLKLVADVIERDAPRLREKRPEAPADLDAVLARGLAREPGERFSDMAELAAALYPFGTERARASFQSISGVLGVDPEVVPSPPVEFELDAPPAATPPPDTEVSSPSNAPPTLPSADPALPPKSHPDPTPVQAGSASRTANVDVAPNREQVTRRRGPTRAAWTAVVVIVLAGLGATSWWLRGGAASGSPASDPLSADTAKSALATGAQPAPAPAAASTPSAPVAGEPAASALASQPPPAQSQPPASRAPAKVPTRDDPRSGGGKGGAPGFDPNLDQRE